MNSGELAGHVKRLKGRLSEVEALLSEPDVYSRPSECKRLSRERQRLSEIFEMHLRWSRAEKELEESRQMASAERDAELKSLAEAETVRLEAEVEECSRSMLVALLPPDADDARDTIVEIRPAAGGDEAALFAGEMYRLYIKYAERRGWRHETLDLSESELGGVKEAVVSLSGDDVFSRMKFESGVHRVQRVPTTEACGRIHTSTITVSVLPEVEELDEIEIRSEDIRVDVYRSSGPGGQNVNRTDSAVRITHIPSGLVVASQQERSQIRNREIAMRILKARLLEAQRREEADRHAATKRSQVGTGDRSERIRTYNFPQNRVTDHRYGISVHDLPGLMEGDMDLLLDQIVELESAKAIETLLASQ